MTSAFKSNLKHLIDCRNKLTRKFEELDEEEQLVQISAASSLLAADREDDDIPSSSSSTPLDDTHACTLPQQQRIDGTHVRTMEGLYKAATMIQPTFQSLLKNMISQVSELHDPMVELKLLPPKDQSRAETKLQNYNKRFPGSSVSWLYDILRCSVVCYNVQQIQACLQYLQTQSTNLSVCLVKNRFAKPALNGYRDLLVYIQVNFEKEECKFSHVCEIQLHLAALWELANHVDSYISYQYFRNVFATCTTDIFVNTVLKDFQTLYPEDANSMNYTNLRRIVANCQDVHRLWALETLEREYFNDLDLAYKLLERAMELHNKETTDNVDEDGGAAENSQDEEKKSEQMTPPDSSKVTATNDMAVTLEKMASIKVSQGDLKEGLDKYIQALEIHKETLGPDHPHVAKTCHQIGTLLFKEEEEDHGDALPYYQMALRIEQDSNYYGTDSPETAKTMLNIAILLREKGKLKEAMTKSQSALEIFRNHFKPDSPEIVDALVNMANIRYNQDQLEEAIELYYQALNIVTQKATKFPGNTAKSFSSERVQVADILYQLAVAKRDAGGQDAHALNDFQHALVIYTNAHGDKHAQTIMTKRQVQRLQRTIQVQVKPNEFDLNDNHEEQPNKPGSFSKKQPRKQQDSSCVIS